MQGEINDAHLGLANSRIPPTWSVENDRKYPLRYYRHDLEMWAACTDMEAARQGPAASMRITGAARLIIREMPVQLLVQGQAVADAAGNLVQVSGLGMLLRTLERRYGATEEETQIHSISELMNFSRGAGESTDEVLARFDITVHRADNIGGVLFGPQLKAWMILTHLRIPRTAWMTLLSPTNGLLPATPGEYADFAQYLRRNGHLHDNNHAHDKQKSIAQPYFTYWGNDNTEPPPAPVYAGSTDPYSHDGPDDNISWHSYSTGQSDDDEPLDWSDFHDVPVQFHGEHAYMAYRGSKRRWRSFAGKGRKRFKGTHRKGGGKGGKSSKGHTQARAFWTDDFGNNFPLAISDHETTAPVYVFKGKGKGGNPVGKDGKIMLCSICESDQHFRAKCPKGTGKGKGSGKGKSAFWQHFEPDTSATSSSTPLTPQVAGQPRKVYFAGITDKEAQAVNKSMIYFEDGSDPIPLNPTSIVAKSTTQAGNSTFQHYFRSSAYVWINETTESTYHMNVKLKLGEALLVDTGAFHNLAGDRTFKRIADAARLHGHGADYSDLHKNLNIDGVGGGDPSICKQRGKAAIVLSDGQLASYQAPLIENSDVPCLLGAESMTNMRVVLDLVHDKWISLGPGGMEMKLSPGSQVLALQRAPTGHIMLPCTEWLQLKAGINQPGLQPSTVALPTLQM